MDRGLTGSPDRLRCAGGASGAGSPVSARQWRSVSGPVLSAQIEPRVGGRFHIRFRMEDGSEHGSSGPFELFDPPRALAMSLTWYGEPEESRVEVTLREIDEGTEHPR